MYISNTDGISWTRLDDKQSENEQYHQVKLIFFELKLQNHKYNPDYSLNMCNKQVFLLWLFLSFTEYQQLVKTWNGWLSYHSVHNITCFMYVKFNVLSDPGWSGKDNNFNMPFPIICLLIWKCFCVYKLTQDGISWTRLDDKHSENEQYHQVKFNLFRVEITKITNIYELRIFPWFFTNYLRIIV